MHHSLVAMLRHVNPRVFYAVTNALIIPPCLLFSPSRGIAYRYFRERHHLSRRKAAWATYRNHCLFGQVVIDRFAMYAGRKFDIEIEGYDHFQRLAELPEGFIQLSAHVGNYELAGYSLKAEQKRFNALVFAGEKQSVMEGRQQMFQGNNLRMIPIRSDMGHLFDISQALSDGETVSMPADRIFGSDKAVTVNFLGVKARLPQGPFRVATMRGLDVIAVNVMKTAPQRYKIYVSPLEYDKQAPRREQVTQIATLYAHELQRVITLHPLQWYNYYEFWNQ
ncbi:MAG: lysophospholipid acyltransferase family protein [Bacteroidales bacterium]|nr:lysophospholipid acyltransferase family protein [Bacteroidales bacterium]MCD8395012.1 lysophospholipid acyltransferase family protein [Bacteroidales bacterium]